MTALLLAATAASPFVATDYRNADSPAVFAPASAGRAPTTRGFQGIPTIEETPGGRLVAAWYGGGSGETADNYLVVAESGDRGETWRETATVKSTHANVRDFDPVLWRDPDGALWLLWTQSACVDHWKGDGRLGVWASVCRAPDAERLAWEPPRRLSVGSVWTKPIVLKDGTWAYAMGLYDHHNEDCKRFNGVNCSPHGHEWPVLPEFAKLRGPSMVASTDRGKTWQVRGTADVPNRCFEENQLVERKDGTLAMYVRTHYGVAVTVSADGGRTWTQGRDAGFYGPNSRFAIRRLKSGNLLMVNHEPDGTEDVKKEMWRPRKNLTAYLSEDDGRTWPHRLQIDARDSVSYPDFAQSVDGAVFVVHDCARTKGGYVLLSRLTENDVRAGRVVTPGAFLRRTVSRTIRPDELVLLGDGDVATFGWWPNRYVLERYTRDRPDLSVSALGGQGTTAALLAKLESGLLDGRDPKAVVLRTGREDKCSVARTLTDVARVLRFLETRFPKCLTVLMAADRDRVALNRELPKLVNGTTSVWADPGCTWRSTDGAERVINAFLRPVSERLASPKSGRRFYAGQFQPILTEDQDGLPYEVQSVSKNGEVWWRERMMQKQHEIAALNGTCDLVFIGDSITHNWEKDAEGNASRGGKVLAELRRTYSVLDLGYGGDGTSHVIWRCLNGELDGYAAKFVMLMIGTNNTGAKPEDVAAAIRRILDIIRRKQPQAKVLLLPIFPRGATPSDRWNRQNLAVNALIRPFADGETVLWHDFSAKFFRPDGSFDPALMGKDNLHPVQGGYELWRDEILPIVRKVVGK